MLVEPIYRGILAADIEGFGRLERSNPVRVHLRAALYRLIDQSLAQAGIEPWRCEHTDHGDCVLILLEPQFSKTRLLHPFVSTLAAALARHNRRAPTAERLRLRVVVHAGDILRDAHGHSGEDLNTAFRLLDSEPLHACLAQSAGDLAVIVSDVIYQAIVKHGYRRIDPAGYRPVTVVAKETNARAWIHAPEVPRRTPPRRAARAQAPPPPTVRQEGSVPPAQLPGDVAWFTGRRHELRRLRELLASTGGRQAAVVAAVHGIGGVGKSALALRAAHALGAHFPDGQLYVDLRGSSVSGLAPLAPEEAVGRLLRALGPDGESVPVGLEEAVMRLRSLLSGRRVLVVLDNAASAAQVRPLLPATTGSAAIVTSRQVLFALEGAVNLHLDVLPPKEAVALLRQSAGSERVAAEPAAAETVAQQCGCLPLALRIAAARLAARPSWPLHALAEQLADERRRLDRLQLGDLAVRASFQLSYQALLDSEGGALAARTFRLLGLLDGADVSLPVAAALVGRSPGTVEVVLERLVDAQMLESPVPGRYRLHDLLRLFAREKAGQEERASARRAAVRRALHCYLASAQRANQLVAPVDPRLGGGGAGDGGGGVGAGAVKLGDRRAALAWLEAERGNLIAAAQQAAVEPGPLATVTVELASALFWFLQAGGYWRDWEALNQLAVQVTRRLGDRANLGNRDGEQVVLSNLGIVYRECGRLDEALSSCEQSLSIARESGDRYGQAILLNSLGKIYRGQECFDAAIRAYANCLSIFEELGDPYGQGSALTNLGEICCVVGRPGEAADYCKRALALFREVGDRSDEAEALWRLGSALNALGQREQARARWREALAIFESIGAPSANEVGNLLRGDSPAPE